MEYPTYIKTIDFNKCIKFDDYERKDDFKHVANIVIDTSTKNTVIKFVYNNKDEWKINNEWLYIFTVDDYIVKIGGTRTSLFDRATSYLCGHHIKARGKSGKCSETNAYCYNTFDFYLNQQKEITMYGFKLPVVTKTLIIYDTENTVVCQTYQAYESIYINKFKEKYGKKPPLSDNSDPHYK